MSQMAINLKVTKWIIIFTITNTKILGSYKKNKKHGKSQYFDAS